MSRNKAILATLLVLAVLAAAFVFCEKYLSEPPQPDLPESSAQESSAQESSAQESSAPESSAPTVSEAEASETFVFDYSKIPEYSGEPYAAVNGNAPTFTADEITAEPFERYSDLDSLGRCGAAFANVCTEIMPTEERGSISSVKPSGWQSATYDFVDGRSLYNRCHLIGYQLSGENANKRNLITGTRYLNVVGMLPFENLVADYVKETDGHVLYRVTPIFVDDEAVARGVWMEGYSVEDEGDGVYFSVFCYNVQPGVVIDYATGESSAAPQADGVVMNYVLNTNTRRFHKPDCSGAADIKKSARQDYKGTRETLIAQGYTPCGKCKP